MSGHRECPNKSGVIEFLTLKDNLTETTSGLWASKKLSHQDLPPQERS